MAKSNSTRRNKAFELPFAPSNRLEANRWLNKATFGPATGRVDPDASTKTSIVLLAGEEDDADKLMRIGYVAYLNEQMSDNTIISAETADAQIQAHRGVTKFNSWWFTNAVHSSAAVRFKTSFALSQIFAARRSAGVGYTNQLKYYDYFVKATLSTNTSSFRTLLDDVTYSQLMGSWLTYNGNKRADVATFQKPDENYAREIMQLFTIGLYQLNLDGTNKLDSSGNPILTYSNEDVRQLAKVFTGLATNSYSFNGKMVATNEATQPLHFHDMTAKTLLPYPNGSTKTIPANAFLGYIPETYIKTEGYVVTAVDSVNLFRFDRTVALSYNTSADIYYKLTPNGTPILGHKPQVNVPDGFRIPVEKVNHGLVVGSTIYIDSIVEIDIKEALDWIFNHPNVGPFISKALIKLMVCSNPSPQYVARVATVFNNNGNGIRGDVAAVIKAMLLDREAILPFGINPNNYGKYTTVLDKLLKTWRAFRNDMVGYMVDIENGSPTMKNYAIRNAVTKPRGPVDFSSFNIETSGSIMPMQTPSVFNFFRPGFVPPGTDLGTLGLTAPELQLVTIDSQTTWANLVTTACETSTTGLTATTGNEALDPRGGGYSIYGLDFNPDPAGWTVTNVNTTTGEVTATGNLNSSLSVRGVDIRAAVSNRTKGNIVDLQFRFGDFIRFVGGTNDNPVAGIPQTILISVDNITRFTVGDILDISSLIQMPQSHIGGNQYIDENNFPAKLSTFSNHTLYHKVALLTPNGATTPTDAELDPAINYLESILLGQAMSPSLKSIVRAAGKVDVVDNSTSGRHTGGATFTNHYLNFVMNRAQKRARHMIAMILISPEYQANR